MINENKNYKNIPIGGAIHGANAFTPIAQQLLDLNG